MWYNSIVNRFFGDLNNDSVGKIMKRKHLLSVLALALCFYVPKIFVGIAFDSGGVASGALATTFLLPFARGACEALGGNIMEDAFGIVALIAMTPLITIQVLGLIGQIRQRNQRKKMHSEMIQIKDDIIYYDGEEA